MLTEPPAAVPQAGVHGGKGDGKRDEEEEEEEKAAEEEKGLSAAELTALIYPHLVQRRATSIAPATAIPTRRTPEGRYGTRRGGGSSGGVGSVIAAGGQGRRRREQAQQQDEKAEQVREGEEEEEEAAEEKEKEKARLFGAAEAGVRMLLAKLQREGRVVAVL